MRRDVGLFLEAFEKYGPGQHIVVALMQSNLFKKKRNRLTKTTLATEMELP